LVKNLLDVRKMELLQIIPKNAFETLKYYSNLALKAFF
jgi:hypothetical protein